MILLKCPFCNHAVAKNPDTYNQSFINFIPIRDRHELNNDFRIDKLKCPNCLKTSYKILGLKIKEIGSLNVFPKSSAISFPEYIPLVLRQDYEEAHAIINLSPKASATLSRRCLQGILRDFYKTNGKTLNAEINSLEGKIPSLQYKVLHSIRKIGNIGAHLEKDVNLIIDINSDDAGKLLALIEHLFKVTYIERFETETLFNEILKIDDEKQNMK